MQFRQKEKASNTRRVIAGVTAATPARLIRFCRSREGRIRKIDVHKLFFIITTDIATHPQIVTMRPLHNKQIHSLLYSGLTINFRS